MTTQPAAPARRLTLPMGDGLLRGALQLDAAVTGANGLAYLALAGPIGDLLGMPSGFLRAVGAFLLAFAAAVAFVGTRPAIPRGPAGLVAEANAAWVVASVVTLVAGWHDPSTAGSVWIGLQAATVGLFAGLQAAGLRRR